MSVPRVFISMGRPYTEESEKFRDNLEAFLRDNCGVEPRIVGKGTNYPPGSPIAHIVSEMRKCSGVIVVAYERKYVEKGAERRGSVTQLDIECKLYTTPWNHIESAVAYTLGLPLYFLSQKDVREEGLIESKEGYVQHIKMDHTELLRKDVIGSIRAWIDARVHPHSKRLGSGVFDAVLGRLKFGEMTLIDAVVLIGLGLVFFTWGALVTAWNPERAQHALAFFHLAPK